MSKTVDKQDIAARIRERAYDFWVREGHPQGRDLDHWLAAEAEVQRSANARVAQTSPKTKTTTRKRSTKSTA